MTQFFVSEDGRLIDELASRAVQSIKEEVPSIDGPSVDAYLALSKAYWSLWSMFSGYCAEYDLSVPRFNLLMLLYQTRDQPRSMTALANHLNVSTANVTKLFASLEQDGWATRMMQESDRRVVFGQLTPEGEAKCKAIMPVLWRRMENLTRGLTTDEKLLLSHLLIKLRLGHLADYALSADVLRSGASLAEAPRRSRAR